MRIHVVVRYVALALLLNSFLLLIASIISMINSDLAVMSFLYSTLITALFGIFPLIFVPATSDITNKEGLSIVVLSWLLSCLVGTLPYILYGGPFSFTNAWFESVSGFTTTGSTILTQVESLPDSILFWRASTHWIGGIGIIIFVLSVLPFIGLAEMVLFRSETSSMVRENFHHRAKKAIQILAGVYIALNLLEIVTLLICGMDFIDAVIHSFATIATGGFSSKNLSIAYYDSLAIEIVIMIFMLLSGIHFAILFSSVTGNPKSLLRSSVVRYYLIAMLIGVLFSTFDLLGSNYESLTEALRYSVFNLISVGTSTGFANADTAIWPAFSQILLILFTLQCACAGSTSGGIKADRIILVGKSFVRNLKALKHPNAVIPVRVDGKAVDESLVSKGVLYVIVYLGIILSSTMLLVIVDVDILEAFSSSAAAMGNVGPGLGKVGSLGNFSELPNVGKWILSITMLLGRLEIYALFIFFTPAQWRKGVTY